MSPERRNLTSRLRAAVLSPERWRAAVTRNLALKLLSLAFAFGLWSFVNFGERDTEEALKVPLELRNIPASLVITSPRVDFIDLRVMGPRTLLGRIDRSRLSIPLDLNGVRPGPAVFRVTAESLNLPRGVRVVRINPATVTLDLEKIGRKTVPIQLRLDGEPPPGFKIVSARLYPESVEVSGPAREVEDIDAVYTQAVDIGDADTGVIDQELSLEPAGDYISFDVPRVAVEVRIEEVLVRREIQGLPIVTRNAVGEAVLRPAYVKVTLRGPKRLVSSLEAQDIQVYVDASLGEDDAKIQVDLPASVELVTLEPRTVTLTLVLSTPTAAASSRSPAAKIEPAARKGQDTAK
jgi:YbbR domain-containing protein